MSTQKEIVGTEVYFNRLAAYLSNVSTEFTSDLSPASAFGRALASIDLRIHRRLVQYMTDLLASAMSSGLVTLDATLGNAADYAETYIEYLRSDDTAPMSLPYIQARDLAEFLDDFDFEISFIEYTTDGGVAVRIADYLHVAVCAAVKDLPTYPELQGHLPEVDMSALGETWLSIADEVIRAVELMYISLSLSEV
jgi:hypothetical protein